MHTLFLNMGTLCKVELPPVRCLLPEVENVFFFYPLSPADIFRLACPVSQWQEKHSVAGNPAAL